MYLQRASMGIQIKQMEFFNGVVFQQFLVQNPHHNIRAHSFSSLVATFLDEGPKDTLDLWATVIPANSLKTPYQTRRLLGTMRVLGCSSAEFPITEVELHSDRCNFGWSLPLDGIYTQCRDTCEKMNAQISPSSSCSYSTQSCCNDITKNHIKCLFLTCIYFSCSV